MPELTYMAWDLQSFAQDVGYHGAPFEWDEERCFLMRYERDALFIHLYHIARDDVGYILGAFLKCLRVRFPSKRP